MASDQFVAPYAEDVVSAFDIWKPDVLSKLFRRYGHQGLPFFMWFKMMGFELPVANKDYSHYEDSRWHQNLKVKAIVSAPASSGDTITFALHADSLDGTNYYVRKWDTILMNDGSTGVVTNIAYASPDYNVTVTPNQDVIFPALAANELLGIIGNAHSEGGDQPAGRITKTRKVSNCTQIIKERVTATGSEMTNEDWFAVSDEGEKAGPYYNWGLLGGEFRQAQAISHTLIHQEKTVDTQVITDSATARNVRTTEGLFPYMRREALNHPVAAGAFAVSDFNTIVKYLKKQYTGKHVCKMSGIDRYQEVEDALVTYLANTDIDYTRGTINEELFNGSDSLAATVNFQAMSKSNYMFSLKEFEALNDPTVTNNASSDVTSISCFFPLDKTKDAKSGELTSYIGSRYKAADGYSRQMEFFSTGGAGNGQKVNSLDLRNWDWRSECGGHWMKGNSMVYLYKP